MSETAEVVESDEIDNNKNGIEHQPLRVKMQLYIISAISNTATFIARAFTGYYAVFIDASTTAISLITSLRNLIQQGVQSTFGRISDKVGRKIMMIIGLIISGVCLAIFPFIKDQWVLVGGVVVFSIGFAIYYPAFTALQGDITNKKNRAGWISLFTIIGAFTTLIWLMIVGFMGDIGSDERMEFIIILEITAGLFIVAAIVSIFLYEPDIEKIKHRSVFSFRPIIDNKNFRRFVIANSIMSFCMSIGWPIFPIVRGTYASNKENSWIWAFFCLFQVIVLLATRKLINKIGRKWLLFMGRVLMFYVPMNLAITMRWVPYWWHLAISGALSGLCNAFYFVGQNSYILDSAPEAEKGTYTGLHNLFIGVSTFLGSLIMGLIADFVVIGDEMNTIFVLLWVIAGLRLVGSMSYLFIKEPKTTILSTMTEPSEVNANKESIN